MMLRKIVLTLSVAFAVCCYVNAQEEVIVEEIPATKKAPAEIVKVSEPELAKDADWGKVMDAIVMYIPNVLVDITDIFSINVGIGPETKLDVYLTRYLQLGGFYGDQYILMKAYNRQYGAGLTSGWAYHDTKAREYSYLENPTGTVNPYLFDSTTLKYASPTQTIYKDGIRDFYAVGFGVGWLVSTDFEIHPVEIADMITGIFFYDLSGDNL